MPLNQLLLVKFSSPFLAFIVVSVSVILSVGGILLMRRLIPHHKLKAHNDVSGPIFATLGVLYAVLLAFVVIVVWQGFDKSQVNVQNEANYVSDLYRDSQTLSPEFGNQARVLLSEYIDTVTGEEWKAMATGKASPRVVKILDRIWALYGSYTPKTAAENAFFDESVRKLNLLSEMRRMRLIDASIGVHPVLWFVLIFGGVATVLFICFFGAENAKVQSVMAILLAMLISLILFTILVLDYPFSGDISISPDAFSHIIEKTRP